MFRTLALLAAFCALSIAFNSIYDIPPKYKDVIPEQVQEFWSGLTDEDKSSLKEVFAKYAEYETLDQALSALKKKSLALHETFANLRTLLNKKIGALGYETEAFALSTIEEVRRIQAANVSGNKPSWEQLKQKVREVVARYHMLSDEAKADLEKQFPITASVFKKEKFLYLVKKNLAPQD